jgi:hypothetical protein
MGILDKLATALGRRDEVPNQELAREIVVSEDSRAVAELIENLSHKSKDIQNDCIKVLYEIGVEKPSLIASYHEDFIKLLDSRNNRLQWGGMTAIGTIALENPSLIFNQLPKLIDAAEKGSVITRDNLMVIFIKLASIKEYAEAAFALFNEQLLKSPINQVPMYAENALPVINESNKAVFMKTLSFRMNDIEKDSAKKRIEKVLRKLKKGKQP